MLENYDTNMNYINYVMLFETDENPTIGDIL